LQIHFDALRKQGRLSRALCCAIDGVAFADGPDDADSMSQNKDVEPIHEKQRKRRKVKRAMKKVLTKASSAVRPVYDLASDANTGGFSGADIAGLVRCAGSLALSRARQLGFGVEDLLITLEDVKEALKEVKQ
jgi:SpoVK/Ycf46/Vps4 family AAA+-type ATPase